MLKILHNSGAATYLNLVGEIGKESWFIETWYDSEVIASQFEDGAALKLDQLLISHYYEVELFYDSTCQNTLFKNKIEQLKHSRDVIIYSFLTMVLHHNCNKRPNSAEMHKYEQLAGRQFHDKFNFEGINNQYSVNIYKKELRFIN